MSLVALVAVMGSAVWAIESGNGGQLAVWGLTFGTLAFVPAALEGLINVRFPSGRPTGRWGRILNRAITWGIALGLLGGLLGDRTITGVYPQGVPGGAARFVDGTPAVAVGNGLIVVIPVVILLGVLAGLGVIVRCLAAEGLERQQLEWRAAGVAYGLLLFPFAVTESLPEWLADLEPLLLVLTLVIPVLRYDLWAIDTLIRRSAVYTLAATGSIVENMMRAVAEMLRLPYVAVRREAGVLASYGEETAQVEVWPLVHQGERLGTLVAAPGEG